MKHVVESLAGCSGVRLALLALKDGVPVAAAGPESQLAEELGAQAAALAVELERAAADQSLAPPRRAWIKASRGCAALELRDEWLLVALVDAGAPLEQLRPALEAAAARLSRAGRRQEPPPPLPGGAGREAARGIG
jgi:predicted regulator of Ras-like GTPase activity (Roadblock/LC7/MglB family)